MLIILSKSKSNAIFHLATKGRRSEERCLRPWRSLLDSGNLHSHFGSFLDLDLVFQILYMIEQNINA